MLSRLYNLWTTLRTGLWFVPTLMAVGAVGLAIIALNLDAGLPEERARQLWWLHSGGPEDARNLLSIVFSSMITMATLVISITMVVLTLAASQLGPRLVRNFMGDLRTQLVFGIFLMTIILSPAGASHPQQRARYFRGATHCGHARDRARPHQPVRAAVFYPQFGSVDRFRYSDPACRQGSPQYDLTPTARRGRRPTARRAPVGG